MDRPLKVKCVICIIFGFMGNGRQSANKKSENNLDVTYYVTH